MKYRPFSVPYKVPSCLFVVSLHSKQPLISLPSPPIGQPVPQLVTVELDLASSPHIVSEIYLCSSVYQQSVHFIAEEYVIVWTYHSLEIIYLSMHVEVVSLFLALMTTAVMKFVYMSFDGHMFIFFLSIINRISGS